MSPLLEENFVSFLSQLAVMSIMINTFQTVFSAISRSSFSNFAFSDLVEPTMAGVNKHLGDSEDFRNYSPTRFVSSIVCEKQWVGRWVNFQK